MKIGNLTIDNPLLLAPMAGITDKPFRIICRELGAGIVFTEFVSANGIIRENLKTLELMKFSEIERPIGIQIFGENPNIVSQSAKMINDLFRPDIIDINYGCPVPKITKKGAGSAALKDLCLMEDITSAVIDSVDNIPVTVKMRIGWDNNNIVSTEAGIRLEKIGVSAITLHARTTQQQFSCNANWDHIKNLKEAVNIPIIGNGDIKGPDDYIRMRNLTRCDGVMIGRGALGNPWIFKIILNKLNDNIKYEPDIVEKIKMCKYHFKLLKEDKNEISCINLAKKHFSYYLKGFNDAAIWRKKMMKLDKIRNIELLLDKMEEMY